MLSYLSMCLAFVIKDDKKKKHNEYEESMAHYY